MNNLLSDSMFLGSVVCLFFGGISLPFVYKRFRLAPAGGGARVLPPSDTPEEFPDEPVKVVEEPETKAEKEEKKPEAEKKEAKAPEPVKKEAAPAKKAPAKFSSGATVVGGVSPAIVYLQNLKLQIEHFEKEIHQLRSQVTDFAKTHDTQFHDLLSKMVEMQKELHQELTDHHQAAAAPPAAKPAPAPKPAAKVEAKPAPAAKPVDKPKAAPADTAAMEIAATLQIDTKDTEITVPAAKEAPKAAAPDVEPTLSTTNAKPGIELSLADDPDPSPKPAGGAEKKSDKDDGKEDILKPEGKGPVWPV